MISRGVPLGANRPKVGAKSNPGMVSAIAGTSGASIIRKASRGEMLDHDGEFFHTKRFRLRIPPYRPGLAIYIAALSPASLRLTGEVA
ncbi:MAG TPA: LLM class flavin-dependent oxidoreductase, partial [Burkholderiales bacterium]